MYTGRGDHWSQDHGVPAGEVEDRHARPGGEELPRVLRDAGRAGRGPEAEVRPDVR